MEPNNYTTSPGFSQDWDQTTFRFDHRLSAKDMLVRAIHVLSDILDSYSPGLIPSTGLTNTNAPHNADHSMDPQFLSVSCSMISGSDLTGSSSFLTRMERMDPISLQFQNIVADPDQLRLTICGLARIYRASERHPPYLRSAGRMFTNTATT